MEGRGREQALTSTLHKGQPSSPVWCRSSRLRSYAEDPAAIRLLRVSTWAVVPVPSKQRVGCADFSQRIWAHRSH